MREPALVHDERVNVSKIHSRQVTRQDLLYQDVIRAAAVFLPLGRVRIPHHRHIDSTGYRHCPRRHRIP